MNIAAMTFRLRASWVHSLKEKRMIVKSLTAQLQNKFHVSAAEIDEQDTYQIIVIGIAAIVPHNAMADFCVPLRVRTMGTQRVRKNRCVPVRKWGTQMAKKCVP